MTRGLHTSWIFQINSNCIKSTACEIPHVLSRKLFIDVCFMTFLLFIVSWSISKLRYPKDLSLCKSMKHIKFLKAMISIRLRTNSDQNPFKSKHTFLSSYIGNLKVKQNTTEILNFSFSQIFSFTNFKSIVLHYIIRKIK